MSTWLLPLSRTICMLACGQACLLALAGCGSLRVEDAHFVDAGDWLTEGDSPQRQYAPGIEVAPPLEEVWSYNANAAFGPGSPLLLGDHVIIATRKGEVHVVDFATGKRRGVKGFGDAVEGTPVIYDGVIYIPVAWGKRSLHAHDLVRGKTLWSVREAPVESGLLALEDRIIAVDAEAHVRGYDARYGTIEWEFVLDSTVTVLASPVAIGERAFAIADDGGTVTALDSGSGEVLWRMAIGAPVHATPSTARGVLYLPTTRGELAALDSGTGEIRWTFSVDDTNVYVASPAVSGEEVVFGASDGILRSLHPSTGELKWEFDAREGFVAAPLIAANTIYAGALDGKLYALDRQTGRVVWKQQLEGRIKSALAARGGYIVVASEPRNVYLFKAVEAGEYAYRK